MEKHIPKGSLGGQAILEGIMMKGPGGYSTAVRLPDKNICVKFHRYKSYGEKHPVFRIPFIRGIANFIESLVLGMKTLSYSSAFFDDEEEESKEDNLFKDIFKDKAEDVVLGLTVCISIVIALALFMFLPAGLAELLGKWVTNHYVLSIIEGIIRLTIFLLYVWLIAQMEDINRLFMYHGAEHKTINCYEAGAELRPENVKNYTRYHKRCGTSFIFVVMIVSIIVFMFITAKEMWLRFLLRLLFVPVIAGISYEFIRIAGRSDSPVWDVLSRPGMLIQKLTTREPDEEMIQVAIVAVETVIYGQAYADAVNEAQGIKISDEELEIDDLEGF